MRRRPWTGRSRSSRARTRTTRSGGCGSRRSSGRRGLRVRADLGRRKLGRQLEAAGKDGAHFAVILGDELADGHVQLRDLLAGTQRVVALEDLARDLARAEQHHKHG